MTTKPQEQPVVTHGFGPLRDYDRTFLTVHPRTALWWEQRKQCARCVHVIYTRGTNHQQADLMMDCGVTTATANRRSCISSRDPGGKCGPEGKHFTPKLGA